MERHRFDDIWRKAFDGAELTPAERMWTNIELDLERSEKSSMRKKVVFYQRIAAALFILVASGAIILYVSRKDEANSALAVTENTEGPKSSSDGNKSNENSSAGSKSSEAQGKPKKNDNPPEKKTEGEKMDGNRPRRLLLAENNLHDNATPNSAMETDFSVVGHRHPFASLTITKEPVIIRSKMRSVTLVRKLPPMPAEFMNTSGRREHDKGLWASLGASAGSFNPNGGISTSANSLNSPGVNNFTGSSKSISTGAAYSFGVSAGTRLSDQWVVQTGVSFLNQSVDYQSSIASLDPSNKTVAYSERFDANLNTGSFTVTSPYTVNNSMELVSIPVQAGYQIIQRKIGWQVNAGVSTDIFLRSVLIDESGRFDRFTQDAGEDSPIRPINWSGLLSTELSYRFGEHYGLAVVPGMRYSLAPLSKPGEGSLGNALIWDVGFRLRYHFR